MKHSFYAALLLVSLLPLHGVEEGLASWYGGKFQGRKTASGERFDTNKLTAAHRTLPFDTVVKVTNLENNRSVEVRINDRGPFVEGRIIVDTQHSSQCCWWQSTHSLLEPRPTMSHQTAPTAAREVNHSRSARSRGVQMRPRAVMLS